MKPLSRWFRRSTYTTKDRPSSRCPATTRYQPPKFKPGVNALEGRCLLSADSILEWDGIMLQADANDPSLAIPEQAGPVLTARAFAIVGAAMYDAYNSIERIGDP